MEGTTITDLALIQKAFYDFYSNLLCCNMDNMKKLNL